MTDLSSSSSLHSPCFSASETTLDHGNDRQIVLSVNYARNIVLRKTVLKMKDCMLTVVISIYY